MRNRDGFTLAELMIALAITAILVVLLANVVSAALTAWQQGRNRLDTFSTARQLIGRMTDELTAAVAATDRMSFVENTTDLGPSNPGTSENVFFVAPYPNSGAGDLCVIMYRHNAATRQLERRFVDSAAAWNVAANGRYRLGSYPDTTPTSWRPVADGVMDFELRSYSQQDLDNNANPTVTWDSTSNTPAMLGKTPRRIVLRLKVVDDRTRVRLAGMQVGSPTYNQTVAQDAREFVADFRLPGG